jgi:hypothetical protein
MCEEGKGNFNDVSLFMLSRSILLMRMWAGHQMSNAHMLKKGAKLMVLTPPPPTNQFA